jgi:hypothetical protein
MQRKGLIFKGAHTNKKYTGQSFPLWAISHSRHMQTLESRLIPAPFPPSPSIILAYPLSPSSHLPSSFLNLCSSAPQLRSGSRSAMHHLLSPPFLIAAAPHSLLHSRSTHLFFTFFFSNYCTLGCCWC